MVENELLATISGAAQSLLFYENVKGIGDQMGFLFGEVQIYVTKKVTDDDRQIEFKNIHVDIQSTLPCSSISSLYDSSGKLNINTLKKLLETKGKEIVGWYRFRLNSSLSPTFRDKIIHRQLENFFSNDCCTGVFFMCMLNYTITPIGGTHKFRHVFLQYKNGIYRSIPLRINNLGADASRHDGSDYKPTPIQHSNRPNNFTKLIKDINLNTGTSGIAAISEIQEIAEKHLRRLVPNVCQSDLDVAQLECKLYKLREMIRNEEQHIKRNS